MIELGITANSRFGGLIPMTNWAYLQSQISSWLLNPRFHRDDLVPNFSLIADPRNLKKKKKKNQPESQAQRGGFLSPSLTTQVFTGHRRRSPIAVHVCRRPVVTVCICLLTDLSASITSHRLRSAESIRFCRSAHAASTTDGRPVAQVGVPRRLIAATPRSRLLAAWMSSRLSVPIFLRSQDPVKYHTTLIVSNWSFLFGILLYGLF